MITHGGVARILQEAESLPLQHYCLQVSAQGLFQLSVVVQVLVISRECCFGSNGLPTAALSFQVGSTLSTCSDPVGGSSHALVWWEENLIALAPLLHPQRL